MSHAQEQAASEANPAVKTILVVEDDKSIGIFFVEAIKQETPHQALLASDSFQALKIVQDLKPDLLLLDYSLPRMNGLELYDKLHAMKELEHVPALLISANPPLHEVKKRKIRCMKKPVELDELLAAITALLT